MPTRTSPVTVAEAHIQTVSVEIKALIIGKKQMTLSVFRQLHQEHIIEPGVGFRGEPWGLVNYFWDDCGYVSHSRWKHLHVIWVREGKLLRACVGQIRYGALWNHSRYRKLMGDRIAAAWIGEEDGPGIINPGYHTDMSLEDLDVRVGQWNTLYDQLAALDQLFIAV